MFTIWKYVIEPCMNIQIFDMPIGAVILSFGADAAGKMCFWAQVDPSAALERRQVICIGTGWPLEELDEGKYGIFIGTAIDGPCVWHLYDLGAEVD